MKKLKIMFDNQLKHKQKENPKTGIRSFGLAIGIIIGLLLLSTQIGKAQTVVPKDESKLEIKEYKCTPCGCSQDDVIVHEGGKCKTCGMALINIHDPNEGLNYTNLTAQQVCDLIGSNPKLLLLDVRSKAEFASTTSPLGRFKNAINIPITEIEGRIDELKNYKEKEILVYCSISARSPRVSKILADNGYTKIRNLMDGLNGWHKENTSNLPCQKSAIEKPSH